MPIPFYDHTAAHREFRTELDAAFARALASKHVGGYGSGGAATTDDAAVARAIGIGGGQGGAIAAGGNCSSIPARLPRRWSDLRDEEASRGRM